MTCCQQWVAHFSGSPLDARDVTTTSRSHSRRRLYRMLSTFTTTVRSLVDLELDPAAAAEQRAAHERQRTVLARRLADLETGSLKDKFERWWSEHPTFPRMTGPCWMSPRRNPRRVPRFVGWRTVSGWSPERMATVMSTRSPRARRCGVLGLGSRPSLMRRRRARGPGRAGNGNFAEPPPGPRRAGVGRRDVGSSPCPTAGHAPAERRLALGRQFAR